MNPLADDLDHVMLHTRGLWDELRGGRLFITGGTGFVGCWLLESFAWANDRLNLRAEAVVLTRDPEAFGRKAPHLAGHPAIRLYRGDVRDFVFPEGRFTHVVHAAVPGTTRALTFAARCHAERMLLVSSGAADKEPPRAYVGSAYRRTKRAAERAAVRRYCLHGLPVKIARLYSFIGPYLPLDGLHAAGNFLRDGLRGGPIDVKDGAAHRSYLYAADMAVWLWVILFKKTGLGFYEVGGEESVSIAELAAYVAAHFGVGVQIAAMSHPIERYVPGLRRTREELGLREWVSLPDAIARTARWHQREGVHG